MADNKTPLAYRMAPETLDEYVGQEDIIGKDKMLYRLIKADRLSSIILWGPPGCGKTSLARVIAHTTKNKFEKLNAVRSIKKTVISFFIIYRISTSSPLKYFIIVSKS